MTVEALSADQTRTQLRTDDGEVTAYHEAGSDEDVLVLLHGSGPGVSAWSNFGANLPVFAEHFRTVMPDLPGFGGSSLPALDRVYSVVAAERVLRLLDRLGIERVDLLGNSMGGTVSAELALMAPDRVRRLVLMGPGGLAVNMFGPSVSEGAHRLYEFLAAPSREAMRAWISSMVYDQAAVTDELIDQRMANASVPGAVEAARAIFATFTDPALTAELTPLWTRAQQLHHPTLLTWGRDDRMIPYEFAHFSFRQLPDAELHTFARCGHWAQVERKTDFERVVLEFLTRS